MLLYSSLQHKLHLKEASKIHLSYILQLRQGVLLSARQTYKRFSVGNSWLKSTQKTTRSSHNLECVVFTQHKICTINYPCGIHNLKLSYEVGSAFQCVRCLIKALK